MESKCGDTPARRVVSAALCLLVFNVTDVTIIDTIPANTTFNPGLSTAGRVCAPGLPGQATCALTLGELPAGSAGTIDLRVGQAGER